MKQLGPKHKMNYDFIVQNDCAAKCLYSQAEREVHCSSLHEDDDIGVTFTFTWHTDRRKLKFDQILSIENVIESFKTKQPFVPLIPLPDSCADLNDPKKL